MLLNEYTLPQLLDLALRVPEVGAVNFNILHTVLKTIISELELHKVKPWCHIENPVVARAALTNLKLQSPQKVRKSRSEDHITIKEVAPSTRTSEITPAEGDDDEEVESSEESDRRDDSEDDEKSDQRRDEEDDEKSDQKGDEEDEQGSSEKDEESDEDVKDRKAPAPKKKKGPHKDIPSRIAESGTTAMASDMWRTTNLNWRMQATEEGLEKLSFVFDKMADKLNDTNAIAIETKRELDSLLRPQIAALSDRLDAIQDNKADKVDLDAIKGLTMSLQASMAENQNLMAMLQEKMVGGGSDQTELVQEYDDRIHELEERLKHLLDHLGLEEPFAEETHNLDDRFSELWAQIEAMKGKLKVTSDDEEHVDTKKIEEQERLIKYLKDQLETLRTKVEIVENENNGHTVQIDTLQNVTSDLHYTKADKAQIEAELDGKADKKDLALKVDRTEFVATVEDLGDSIDEFVEKFKKNETEWHTAVNSINEQLKLKLSTADYETLQIPIHNRIKALMYGFKKLKEIINSTLYPDAAGVTKCISCGRPAELAGTKCKPCGDMDPSVTELGGSGTAKTLSLSDLKRPGDDHPPDGGGQSTVSLPDSTIIPPKTVPKKKSFMDEDINPGGVDLYQKKRREELEEHTAEEAGSSSKNSAAKTDNGAEVSSLVKGIGLPHHKSKKEMDHEFELLMATSPSTRFCGGTHTRTVAQQRGVTFSEFVLPEKEKDHMVLIGYDDNWYSGAFPAEKVGELPFDVDPSSVDMEDILDSCYDPYPPLPPKKYSETPRFCGGHHTLTDSLQRGLNFSPFMISPSPVRAQIEIEGSDGAVYVGLEDAPGCSHETPATKDKKIAETETSTSQPSVINLPINPKGDKKPSLKRKGLTVVDIPTDQFPKMDSVISASNKKKSSKKRK